MHVEKHSMYVFKKTVGIVAAFSGLVPVAEMKRLISWDLHIESIKIVPGPNSDLNKFIPRPKPRKPRHDFDIELRKIRERIDPVIVHEINRFSDKHNIFVVKHTTYLRRKFKRKKYFGLSTEMINWGLIYRKTETRNAVIKIYTPLELTKNGKDIKLDWWHYYVPKNSGIVREEKLIETEKEYRMSRAVTARIHASLYRVGTSNIIVHVLVGFIEYAKDQTA